MTVAALIDTNVLVYRFDGRFPGKQRVAAALLKSGILNDSIRLPHQAILEFVAATTRHKPGGKPILSDADARREAEEFLVQFDVLHPNDAIVRLAIRGAAAYGLSWFDAHIWACAEYYGMTELYSEDFQHDRVYGTVRVIDPFQEC